MTTDRVCMAGTLPAHLNLQKNMFLAEQLTVSLFLADLHYQNPLSSMNVIVYTNRQRELSLSK